MPACLHLHTYLIVYTGFGSSPLHQIWNSDDQLSRHPAAIRLVGWFVADRSTVSERCIEDILEPWAQATTSVGMSEIFLASHRIARVARFTQTDSAWSGIPEPRLHPSRGDLYESNSSPILES